ncbi:hypothetical protein GOP47_0012460 [Adiantum capillus-veneris]|uniref:Uncharacterized protein n=1 Tax=Adiantum capillus-veneris TaxID=13818 RepID=A0A9D4ZEG0_ADICA|nr:hypothetical protein GOP47_0012460 [Adiantum capillus-veneris]
MENYGNDMYLSHPSIDFTLLDRPSGSTIAACEPIAHFPQGDTSFSSFNLFGGAELQHHTNQSITDTGSYALQAHKNLIKRHASGGFVSLSNQSEGVHDFLEQCNQPEKSDSGVWPRGEQSAHFLPRVASADERVLIPFYQKSNCESPSHHDEREQVNAEATMPHTSVGFLKSMSREAMDHSRLINASQKDSRNQAFSFQGVLNVPPSSNFGSSSSTPIKSGVPSHYQTIDNISNCGAQYQNQVESYDGSSQTGVAFDHAPSYNFSGNQGPWKGAMQHAQAVASKQLQGFTRRVGSSELQSQQQLQELFLAQHLKQLEDARPEQAANHSSRTSYSELLHGPDTPPQQQTTDEFENPSQNAEAMGWSVDAPLNYQGVMNDLGMQQNYNSSQMSRFREPVDLGSHLGNLKDHNGPPLASHTVGQLVPEHVSPSSCHQVRKPAIHPGSQHLTGAHTREFDLGSDWNNDLRKNTQPLAKSNATHYPSGESVMKQKGGNLSHANAFSQSQQYFQELQFVEQRNTLFEPKHPVSNLNVSFLPQSLNFAKGALKNGMQQYSNNFSTIENLVGCMSQNLPGIPSGFVAPSGQPQWMTSTLLESSSRPTAVETGGQHQVKSWEGLQAPQPRRGARFDLESAPETGYSSPQQLSQQGSPMLGVPLGQFEASDTRQQGLYNTQVIAMKTKTSVAGSGCVPNQQMFMPLSNARVQPASELPSQLQGALQTPQPSKGACFDLESAPETRYSSPRQLSQQGSSMLGVTPGQFEASDTQQQGLYNTQAFGMKTETSVAASGSVPNRQTFMPSNARVQPASEPSGQFQGAWKKYTPLQFPRECGSLGQQSSDGLRPQHGFQQQTYQNPEAPYYAPAMSSNHINPGVPYVSNQLVHDELLALQNRQLLENRVIQDQTASLPIANVMKTVSRHAVKLVPDVTEENQSGSHKSMEPQDMFVERQREVPQQQVNSCTANVSLAHLRGNQSSSSLSPQHFRLGLGPSQDSQHPIDASWSSFPNQNSSSGDIPTLKSAHKSLSVQSPQRRAVFESTRNNEIELNQGSCAYMKRMGLQSSGTSPSVFINRPPPALQETAPSDTSPSSSFVSGHVRGGTSLVSASRNPYPGEYNTGREPTQSSDQARLDMTSGILQGQKTGSNCASHQDAVRGYSGKYSSISNYSKLPDYSANALPMQKKHLVDSSTQLDKDESGINVIQDHKNNFSFRQVGNSWHAVDSEGLAATSKSSVLEHPQIIVDNEQELSGIMESSRMPSNSVRGVSDGNQKQETMQRPSMTLRNSDNWRGEEHSIQAPNMQYAYGDQLNAYRVAQFGNEVRGSMPKTSSSNIQGERHHLSSSVDGGTSHHLQAWRPSQETNKYQHEKSVDFHPSETKSVGRNTRRPPPRAPSSVMRPGMQPSICEDLGQRQSFRRHEPSARTAESATLPLPETSKLSSEFGNNLVEHMHARRWSTNLHAKNVESAAVVDALQRHSVSVSESKSQDMSQPLEHSQMQKALGKCQTVPNPSNFNHHSLNSAGFEHINIQPPEMSSHEPAGNKEIQVAASDNQVPLGFNSSTMKEETVRTSIQGPVSMPKGDSQLSSLRAITPGEVAPPSKKRKKQLPLLIPWHVAVAQPSINLPSNSDAEMAWATALNRIPEKDVEATHEENTLSVLRARKRLILTTESMQRLFPPLLDGLMHEKTPAEGECVIYGLAKRALEDACRLVAMKDQAVLAESSPSTINSSSQGQVCGTAKDSELAKCVENFMDRVKHLGMELARLDCSTSVSELQGETHELEKLSIVNRLAKHHGIGFTMDSSDNLFIENIFEFGVGARRPTAQRYVTATAMPRTLPEGVRCLSL